MIFYRTSLFFVCPQIFTTMSGSQRRLCLVNTSLFFVVMYLAPMSLMMVLNGMLLIALRRSQKSRVTTLWHAVAYWRHDVTL